MKQINPPHPGLTIKEDILPKLELTVTEAATQLGITRAAFSRVLNGKAGISPAMALRLEAWLGIKNGGGASAWLSQQATYDLWQTTLHPQTRITMSSSDFETFTSALNQEHSPNAALQKAIKSSRKIKRS